MNGIDRRLIDLRSSIYVCNGGNASSKITVSLQQDISQEHGESMNDNLWIS